MREVRFDRKRLKACAGRSGHPVIGTSLARVVGWLVMSVVVVLLVLPALASAEVLCTNTWVGGSSGSWSESSNWSKAAVPSSSDVVCVGSGDTVEVNGGSNYAGSLQDEGNLAISNGSLELTGSLTEEVSTVHSLAMTGGAIVGAGPIDVTSSFTGSGTIYINGSDLIRLESAATGSIEGGHLNLGGSTFENEGKLSVSTSSGIQGDSHTHLINTGTLTVNGEPWEENHGLISPSGSTLTNTGTFRKTEGSGTTQVEFAIDNEGTVSDTSGTLEFTGGGSAEGSGSWIASGE
jgi:hypothetical protein